MVWILAQMPGLPNMLWLCLLSESLSSVNPEPLLVT